MLAKLYERHQKYIHSFIRLIELLPIDPIVEVDEADKRQHQGHQKSGEVHVVKYVILVDPEKKKGELKQRGHSPSNDVDKTIAIYQIKNIVSDKMWHGTKSAGYLRRPSENPDRDQV
jgi:hypothetical protein